MKHEIPPVLVNLCGVRWSTGSVYSEGGTYHGQVRHDGNHGAHAWWHRGFPDENGELSHDLRFTQLVSEDAVKSVRRT